MDRSAIEPEVLSGGGVSFRGAWSVYELIGPEAEAAVFGQSFLMPTWLTSVLSLTKAEDRSKAVLQRAVRSRFYQ